MSDTAAFQNTDDAPAIDVLAAVRHCANSWDGSARLLGNVRAADISRACTSAIDRIEALEAALRSAREFVERHPALTLIDLAEFKVFLKVPAAFAPEQDK